MKFRETWAYLQSVLDRVAAFLADPFLCAIRLYWGWQFFLTGKGKLSNVEATSEFFASLGLPAATAQATLAGATECFGGLLLLVGLASRLVSMPLIGTMVVAYLAAHREVVVDLWQDSDAFVSAPPFLFLLASIIVFVFGPGRWSVDGLLQSRWRKAGA